MLYLVHARRIDDRPDPGGWKSSGTDLVPFFVDAVSGHHALALAHDVAGYGIANVTRTFAWVFSDEDPSGDVHHSAREWRPSPAQSTSVAR